MCGISAFSGFDKEKNADLIKFKKLLLWNGIARGEDATGIYSKVNGIIKDNDRVDIFLGKKNIKPDHLMIGHVRAKTVGANLASNAHPFEEKNLILVHNGTLDHPKLWAESRKVSITGIDVDSHMLCKILAEAQSFEPLRELPGAAALVMYDKNTPETMYVFRNKERPLYRGYIDGEGMYISSIEDSLKSIGCTNVEEFKDETLYTIHNGRITKALQWKIKSFKPKVETTVCAQDFYEKGLWFGLRGSWVKCDSLNHNKAVKGLQYDHWYFVQDVTDIMIGGTDKRCYIKLKTKSNDTVFADPIGFQIAASRLGKGTYAVALYDLLWENKGKNEVCIPKGAVVKVTGEEFAKDAIDVDYKGEIISCYKRSFRRITPSEVSRLPMQPHLAALKRIKTCVEETKIGVIEDPMVFTPGTNGKNCNAGCELVPEGPNYEVDADTGPTEEETPIIVTKEWLQSDFKRLETMFTRINNFAATIDDDRVRANFRKAVKDGLDILLEMEDFYLREEDDQEKDEKDEQISEVY
jgi:hypothetical protein